MNYIVHLSKEITMPSDYPLCRRFKPKGGWLTLIHGDWITQGVHQCHRCGAVREKLLSSQGKAWDATPFAAEQP